MIAKIILSLASVFFLFSALGIAKNGSHMAYMIASIISFFFCVILLLGAEKDE